MLLLWHYIHFLVALIFMPGFYSLYTLRHMILWLNTNPYFQKVYPKKKKSIQKVHDEKHLERAISPFNGSLCSVPYTYFQAAYLH